MTNIKQETSKIVAEVRKLFTKCNCREPQVTIDFKYIKPLDGYWKYSIYCNYCGRKLYEN